jgi:hypothetical protein
LHVSTDSLLMGEGPEPAASAASPEPPQRRPRSKRTKTEVQE